MNGCPILGAQPYCATGRGIVCGSKRTPSQHSLQTSRHTIVNSRDAAPIQTRQTPSPPPRFRPPLHRSRPLPPVRPRSPSAHLVYSRPIFYSILAAGLIVALLSAWPFTLDHLEAVAVLDQVSGRPVPQLVSRIVSHPIRTQDLTLGVESGHIRARLYLPKDDPNAPALVVLHGVHHLGIDEPRLVSFATAMASCGMRVLTPELPDIKDYHVDSNSIRTIGESAHWFAEQTGGPVGVMGLSFSGGLALVAAADPLYHHDFKFVFAVGSQDSMGRVAQYYLTNQDERPSGTIELLPAHEYGPLVLEYQYVQDFVPKQDVPAIRNVLRAHLYEDKDAERAADAQLTEPQKLEALELMDATSTRTRNLIAAANAKHAEELAGLSPASHLKTFTTPVYLLHGQADNIIPSAETLWMASQLPSTSLQAMLVSPILSHIDVSADPSVLDQWRLIHFFALIMHATQTPNGRTPWL
jgi:dienelactone hydrolase